MYSTFRFYNQKGQRLSIIGLVDTEKNEIAIRYIAHNKKDIFTRKKGTEILLMNTPLEYPTIITDTLPHTTRFRDFINYCNASFVKVREIELDATKVLSIKATASKMGKHYKNKTITIKYLG